MSIRTAGDDAPLEEQHDINVTPFIDVMLVLLIIFMVAAPLATVAVPVDLPASAARPQPLDGTPLQLGVAADLSLWLDQQPVSRPALALQLEQRTGGDHERRIFLSADRHITYGDLAAVMDLLRSAGYLKVVLVAQEQAAP